MLFGKINNGWLNAGKHEPQITTLADFKTVSLLGEKLCHTAETFFHKVSSWKRHDVDLTQIPQFWQLVFGFIPELSWSSLKHNFEFFINLQINKFFFNFWEIMCIDVKRINNPRWTFLAQQLVLRCGMMPGDHHHSQQLPLQTLLEFSFVCPSFLSTHGKISAALPLFKDA